MKTMSALKATAAIGVAIVLALLTVQGTLALWTATATTTSQTVQSADFKVTAAVGENVQRLPAGGTITVAGPTGLTPGTSQSTPIVVTNAADASGPFTISATAGTTTATGALAPYLSTSIGLGQDGRCTNIRQDTRVVLAKGASATFCLTTTLAENTPATFGGAGASIAFTLATQQQ
ncbi:SipW-dependent-type signal peptide-containing protein [Paeniglutamicibacter sp. ORCA_105]|uniref:SipW-dependent-type signal peptide-containing protein n=1 Tax=Paeniglutamicibacter sp. ORCA_105 TaxID=3377336 RepID=UPI003893A291